MYKINCMPFQRDTAWRAAFRLSDMAYWTLPTEYNLCYVYLPILHLSRQVKMLTESRRLGPRSRKQVGGRLQGFVEGTVSLCSVESHPSVTCAQGMWMGVRVRSGSLCSFLDHQERMSCSFVIRFASGFFGLYSARACASLLALSCLQYRSFDVDQPPASILTKTQQFSLLPRYPSIAL